MPPKPQSNKIHAPSTKNHAPSNKNHAPNAPKPQSHKNHAPRGPMGPWALWGPGPSRGPWAPPTTPRDLPALAEGPGPRPPKIRATTPPPKVSVNIGAGVRTSRCFTLFRHQKRYFFFRKSANSKNVVGKRHMSAHQRPAGRPEATKYRFSDFSEKYLALQGETSGPY